MATILRRAGRPDHTGKPSISYQVKIRIKGQPPITQSFPLKSEAQRWATQTEAAIREGRFFRTQEAERHTVAEFLERYGLELTASQRKAGRQHHLDWFRDQIGALRLSALTPAVIAECRDKLKRETTVRKSVRSPATVNRFLGTLSHALSVATREWGWLDDTPMRKVRKLPEPAGRVRFLSEDERKRLLDACSTSENRQLYPVVVVALSTGARQGEILSLKWSHVDLDRGWIRLQQTKNGERRGLPLKGAAFQVMKDYAKVQRHDTELVFPSLKGKSSNQSLRRSWDSALAASKIQDFRFHDLRHSAASYLAMGGATAGEIAAVLGHKTLVMVKRYAHLSDAHVERVVERMNHRIFAASGLAADGSAISAQNPGAGTRESYGDSERQRQKTGGDIAPSPSIP